MKLLIDTILSRNVKVRAPKQIKKFVNALRSGLSKEAAMRKTWDGQEASDRSQVMLQVRTNDFVIKSLLWETDSSSEYKKAFKEGYRQMAAFKILRTLNLKRDAIKVAERALKRAHKYQLTEVVLSLSIELRQHYAATEAGKNYQYYREFCAEALSNYHGELRAEEIYCELVSHFANAQGIVSPAIIEKTEQYLVELAYISQTVRTFRFMFLYYYIDVLHKQLTNSHIDIIAVCQKALDYFQQFSFPLPVASKFSFSFKAIPSHILLSDFSKIRANIAHTLSIIPEDTINDLVCYKYMVIGGFHHQQYDYALEGIKLAARFKQKPEEWEVFEAYLHLLHLSGQIDYPIEKRIGKLMNEVPILSRDKRGLYVNLLIIQTVHWLLKKEFGKIIDRLDAMKVYQSKHLNSSPFNQTRIRTFIRMLRKIGHCAFQKEESIRQTESLLQELQASPLADNWGNVDIEIFPLEELWKIVIAHLID